MGVRLDHCCFLLLLVWRLVADEIPSHGRKPLVRRAEVPQQTPSGNSLLEQPDEDDVESAGIPQANASVSGSSKWRELENKLSHALDDLDGSKQNVETRGRREPSQPENDAEETQNRSGAETNDVMQHSMSDLERQLYEQNIYTKSKDPEALHAAFAYNEDENSNLRDEAMKAAKESTHEGAQVMGIVKPTTPFLGVDTRVSCGSHAASECEACPQGNGQDWCNGDCEWHGELDSLDDFMCKFKRELVWCGTRAAKECGECPWERDGVTYAGISACRGECAWKSGECFQKRPRDGSGPQWWSKHRVDPRAPSRDARDLDVRWAPGPAPVAVPVTMAVPPPGSGNDEWQAEKRENQALDPDGPKDKLPDDIKRRNSDHEKPPLQEASSRVGDDESRPHAQGHKKKRKHGTKYPEPKPPADYESWKPFPANDSDSNESSSDDDIEERSGSSRRDQLQDDDVNQYSGTSNRGQSQQEDRPTQQQQRQQQPWNQQPPNYYPQQSQQHTPRQSTPMGWSPQQGPSQAHSQYAHGPAQQAPGSQQAYHNAPMQMPYHQPAHQSPQRLPAWLMPHHMQQPLPPGSFDWPVLPPPEQGQPMWIPPYAHAVPHLPFDPSMAPRHWPDGSPDPWSQPQTQASAQSHTHPQHASSAHYAPPPTTDMLYPVLWQGTYWNPAQAPDGRWGWVPLLNAGQAAAGGGSAASAKRDTNPGNSMMDEQTAHIFDRHRRVNSRPSGDAHAHRLSVGDVQPASAFEHGRNAADGQSRPEHGQRHPSQDDAKAQTMLQMLEKVGLNSLAAEIDSIAWDVQGWIVSSADAKSSTNLPVALFLLGMCALLLVVVTVGTCVVSCVLVRDFMRLLAARGASACKPSELSASRESGQQAAPTSAANGATAAPNFASSAAAIEPAVTLSELLDAAQRAQLTMQPSSSQARTEDREPAPLAQTGDDAAGRKRA